jgi:hypothetical protein
MSENIKGKENNQESFDNEQIDENPKLTQITFNNFDGVQIKKHNDSLKKESDLNKLEEEKSMDEVIPNERESDNVMLTNKNNLLGFSK